jgi:hypothetical protein
VLLVVVGLAVRASDAFGCTAVPQSPATLLQDADVIVRARASSVESLSLGESKVRFIVIEQLKGPRQFDVAAPGKLSDHADMNPGPVPYAFVRPSGRGGGCFAMEYQRNGEFLLFLKRVDGVLTPYWAALSATNEQIVGADDKWLVWVKETLKRLKEAGK